MVRCCPPGLALSALLVLASGCSGAKSSAFDDTGGTGGSSSGGLDGGNLLGNGNGTGVPGGMPTDFDDAGGACATSTKMAQLTPINMVIMYDKSGSMGDTQSGFDPAKRWNPVNEGMK